ncbi:hypothetical protein HHK36_007442 [Tetracentron sinense]|uniref:Uncharacterized protein n=1 Tax=Tetracentron sinense TaxID=13715 RepID=A0A834ZNF4_TETSI|nr:hypothetical protein HHK36_007442 [Tetracentron sinense]
MHNTPEIDNRLPPTCQLTVVIQRLLLFCSVLEMGYPEKPQVDGGQESEGKKWVIAGISSRPPLKPISTNSREKGSEDDGERCSTTPTAEEARIPQRLPCPPAPRKRRPSLKCHSNGVVEFFTPPDLDSVFICHVERDK